MKKLSKAILIAVVALVTLAAVGMLGINLYVQSAGMQEKIERELGQQLNVPLRITSTSFTPWGGLRLAGVRVPQMDMEGEEANFLDSPAISARLQLSSLIEKRFVIKEVRVDTPKLIWNQSPNGRWEVPKVAGQGQPTGDDPVDVEQTTKPPKVSTWTSDFKVEVDAVRIDHGVFEFNNAEGKKVASFQDVNVRSPMRSKQAVRGDATSTQVAIYETVSLKDLETKFEHTSDVLALKELGAEIAGGRITGNLAVETGEAGSPFVTDLRFDNVDLNRLITEGGGVEGQAGGTLQGTFNAQGSSDNLTAATGSGQVVLINGRIRQYEFFQSLGQALKVEELARMDLQQAQLDYRLDDGVVVVDPLVLQTANLKLTARGEVEWDGRMALEARLDVNPKISKRLPDFVRDNFAQVEGSDARYVDFDLSGTVANPQTNLMTQMLGKKLETEVTDFIQGIFGKKKKKENKKTPKTTKRPSPISPDDGSAEASQAVAAQAPAPDAAPALETTPVTPAAPEVGDSDPADPSETEAQ